MNVAKGTLTQPGATGNQTISLASNFDPKVILVWGSTLTADGDSTSAREAEFSFGVGTYRSSTVSHWFTAFTAESGDPSVVHCAKNSNNNALMRFLGANDTDVATPTVDCELALVSMSTGGTSNVIVNWVNLHATASIVVHYMILGGSDITDALAGSTAGTGGATTFDQTVVSGFGQPDLVCVASDWDVAGSLGNADTMMSIGWGRSDTEQFVSSESITDGAATADVNLFQRSGKILQTINASGGTASYDAALAAKANWPTDGFRLTFSASTTDRFYWLAIKGSSLNAKVGAITTATSTGNQDTALGFAPSGVMWWGGNMPASASIQTSGTDLAHWHVGATDGTNSGCAGFSEDDANANQRARMHQKTNGVELVTNAAGVITRLNVGSPSFSGNNFRVNWTTAGATARDVLYVAFGPSSSSVDATVTSPAAAATGTAPAPTVAASSSIATPVAGATGTAPAPSVTTANDATVTAPAAAGTGDAPDPTVSAGATVSPPAASGSGQAPAADVPITLTVTTGPASATGSAPAPTVDVGGGLSIDTPVAVGTGDSPDPTVSASSTITAPAAAGAGAAPTSTVTGAASVTSPAADGTGDAPDPAISASASVTSPAAAGTGDSPDPSLAAGATVTSPAASGSGDAPDPTVGSGLSITSPAADATAAAPAPAVSASASVTAATAGGTGNAPAPTIDNGAAATQIVALNTSRTATFSTTGGTTALFMAPTRTASLEQPSTTAEFLRPSASATFEQAVAEIVLAA